jgi:two-component system, chemotaxis family, chemotaxis protein CheY
VTEPNWAELAIAILDEAGHIATLQKSVLRGVGARKVVVAEDLDTLRNELQASRDVLLINWSRPDDSFVEVIAELRKRTVSPDPFVGIILVAPVIHRGRIERAVACGANSFLRFPFRATDLTRHIARLACEGDAFIDCPTYFGPDRRRRTAVYEGPDRRIALARRIFGPELAEARQNFRAARLANLEAKVAAL